MVEETTLPTVIPSMINHSGDPEYSQIGRRIENFTSEFITFCRNQIKLRNDPSSITVDCKRIDPLEFHEDDLRILFSLFIIILYGALVRTIIRFLKISLPYTVILLVSGVSLGAISKHYCFDLYSYTAIARVKPVIILYTFLPVLIFESAFSISAHVFMKASSQILLLALPGMVSACVLTAALCYQFFYSYEWSFLQALLFGSIISATDPVAVVSILKELGASEVLSVLIDGESLLNNGVAILFYELFADLININERKVSDTSEIAGHVVLQFLRIAIGGPIFGYFMAKTAIFCLARVFNDAAVEITITLVAAYLTYYISEDMLGVSGVMALVLLGITLSSERTSISPEAEEEVHQFWSMLKHLANTVLFFITGIIVTERGARDLFLVDIWYLLLLYLGLNIIRLLMLLLLSPLLARTGYGVTWQNISVMLWGGLRGAVGICLALEIYEDSGFCDDALFGPKILFHTAGIVTLFSIINGTTSAKLLDMLQLTTISPGRLEEMHNALKTMKVAKFECISMLKHDRLLTDADWEFIDEFTTIIDPYIKVSTKISNPDQVSLLEVESRYDVECPECHQHLPNEPMGDELKAMTEEARRRVLKAMKISFWSQFEQGVLTEEAVQILVSVADTVADTPMYMIHTSDLQKYLSIRGIFPWMRTKMVEQFGAEQDDAVPPKPSWRCRAYCWKIATHRFFEPFMSFIVALNMIPATYEFIELLSSTNDYNETIFLQDLNMTIPMIDVACWGNHMDKEDLIFLLINGVFALIYTAEFFIKIIGRGLADYFGNKWNYIDFLVLIVSLVDFSFYFWPCDYESLAEGDSSENMVLVKFSKILRAVRITRVLRLIKPIIPAMMGFLNKKINEQLFLGYDITIGYIQAIDDVSKVLKQMIENPYVLQVIKESLDRERVNTVREMGMLQKDRPGIAIAVKTRHASRFVLNQMRNSLLELKVDGLIDEKEYELLSIILQAKVKRLWNSPAYIPPLSPEGLLFNLNWVAGHQELLDFIVKRAELRDLNPGDVIIQAGTPPDGIHLIVSGMVKVSYRPTKRIINEFKEFGAVPNMEIYQDFDFEAPKEDFLSTGTVFGESGVLTGRNRAATVTCETETTVYFASLKVMQRAIQNFSDPIDSLESRLWRSCGIHRGLDFLPTTVAYKACHTDKLQIILERSASPIGPQFKNLDIPSYISDVFVIEGCVRNSVTGEAFFAPSLLPSSTRSIILAHNSVSPARILCMASTSLPPDDGTEIYKCIKKGTDLAHLVNEECDTEENRISMAMNFGVRKKQKIRRAARLLGLLRTTQNFLTSTDVNIEKQKSA